MMAFKNLDFAPASGLAAFRNHREWAQPKIVWSWRSVLKILYVVLQTCAGAHLKALSLVYQLIKTKHSQTIWFLENICTKVFRI